MSAAPLTDRESWLHWRRAGIGGSDVAAIAGVPGFADSSPWAVWADKLGLLPERQASDAMEAGHWLELAISRWFTHKTGLYVHGEQTWCSRPDAPHHRCTVDGFVCESPGSAIGDVIVATPSEGIQHQSNALGVLEIKHEAFGKKWETIPAHYQAQAQWQMHVTGTEHAWFAVLRGRNLDIHELARDQADIDYLVAKVDVFWHDHVLTQIPPPVDDSEGTAHVIAQLYPGGQPDPVDLPALLVADWRDAKAAAEAAEARLTAAANALKAALGDHETGALDGIPAVTWKPQSKRGALDEDALATVVDDLDKYRKPPTTFRVLRPAAKPKGKP
jgi:putative phage-type endonuclease